MTAEAIDRDNLARVLGLHGSDHSGEVIAAARRAEQLRREAGVTQYDIGAQPPALLHEAPRRADFSEHHIVTLAEALDLIGAADADVFTNWELNFRRLWRKRRRVIKRLVAKIIGTPVEVEVLR